MKTNRRPSAPKPRRFIKKPTGKDTKPDLEPEALPKVLPVGIPNQNKYHYDPNFHPQDYIAHCREGNTHSYILTSWGISDSVFRNWIKLHKKFGEAAKQGRTYFNGYWEWRLKECMTQKHTTEDKYINFSMFVWWSKNTMKWSDLGGDAFADAGPSMDFELHDESDDTTYNAQMEVIPK